MLLRRGAQGLLWVPAWLPGNLLCAAAFAAFVWARWGELYALAVMAAPIVPALLFVRWISVRDERVYVGGVLSRGSVPHATARLEVRLSQRHRGNTWQLEVVDPTTGERLPAWSTFTPDGAIRLQQRVGDALGLPVHPPAFNVSRARREAWMIGGIVAFLVAILGAAGLYVVLRPATLTVTLQPTGQVELDGQRLTLTEKLELPRPPGERTEVDVSPGPHRVRFRRDEQSDWTQTEFVVEDHQTYRLWVSFKGGGGFLTGPHGLKKELTVSQAAAP